MGGVELIEGDKMNREKLIKVLINCFEIDKDTYVYNLNRIKTAYLEVSDFEEFQIEDIEAIADCIIENMEK